MWMVINSGVIDDRRGVAIYNVVIDDGGVMKETGTAVYVHGIWVVGIGRHKGEM